ncbi:MAG: hypothetical protein ACFB2Y_03205 [Fulvivirga sp.]
MKRIQILLFGILLPLYSLAQDDSKVKIEDLYTDFAIPDVSSFSLLGIEEDKITRPGNINKLAVQLKELVPFNTISPGVAVEFSPFLLIKKELDDNDSNLEEYRKNASLRGLQLNFATANDSTGSHLGLGIRWVIFDDSDPLMDEEGLEPKILDLLKDLNIDTIENRARNFNRLVDGFRDSIFATGVASSLQDSIEINDLLKDYLANPGPEKSPLNEDVIIKGIEEGFQTGFDLSLKQNQTDWLRDLIIEYNRIVIGYKGRDEVIKSYSTKVGALKEKWKSEMWNARSAHISVGSSWASADSRWGNLMGDKLSFLAGLSWPLQCRSNDKFKGQLILQLLARSSFRDINPEKSRWSLGSKMLFGNSDRRFSIEALYSQTNNRTEIEGMSTMLEDENVLRGTIGWEMKILDGLWFEIAGGFRKVEGGSSDITSFSTLKYAFNGKSRFKTY